MKKNIAVIGCGHWGKNLVRNFSELGALYAVCDPNKELAESFARQYDVKNLPWIAILEDTNIKGVVLAVPAPLHSSMTIEASNAGKHVYVEKPLAMNKTEAEDMIACSNKNKTQLMVGHLLQYHPIFKAMRQLVASGKLGTLNYIYSNRLSFGKARSQEDVIWSFAPHDISMVLSLIGQDLKSIRTESASILQSEIADIATLHLEFISGLKGHISVSWLHPHKEQKLVVIGNQAMAVFDDTKEWEEKLAIYDHSARISDGIPQLKKSEVKYVDVPLSEPLKNECEHFLNVVNKNQTPLTNGSEGLSVLNVLSAASLSKVNKKEVRLEGL